MRRAARDAVRGGCSRAARRLLGEARTGRTGALGSNLGTLFSDEIAELRTVAVSAARPAGGEVTRWARPSRWRSTERVEDSTGRAELVESGVSADPVRRLAGATSRAAARSAARAFSRSRCCCAADGRPPRRSVSRRGARRCSDIGQHIRELEQALRAAAALASGLRIAPPHLPEAVRGRPGGEGDSQVREELVRLLTEHGGNISAVARGMGKARVQIRRWCRRFGIDPEAYRPTGPAEPR